MSRRSSGLVGVWAEMQRQQQRQQVAAQRQRVADAREYERRQRAWQREQARAHRDQQAAYRRQRTADAQRRTDELESEVAALTALLASGVRTAAFRTAALREPEQVEPFAPGTLAHPVPMPDPGGYAPASGGRVFGAQRRAQAEAEARARFEHDWYAAQAAEAQRQTRLAEYRRQYDRWAAQRLAEIRQHNATVERLGQDLAAGGAEAVVEYFSAALYASAGWPDGFPRQVTAAYDVAARQLVLSWQLPGPAVIPAVKSVRYVAGTDTEKETPRPATQRRALYRDVLAQCVLLAVREVFSADEFTTLDSVALTGFVDEHDPVTGRQGQIVLATVTVSRADFTGLHLAQVSAVDCLVDGLGGSLSTRPDQLLAVRPERLPEDVGRGVVSHGDDAEPDLHAMDPFAFEALIADLFRARGMRAVATSRSGDGGVDVEAVDPDPISGGKIVVQVKRYRNTVPPAAVRELFGTVQATGAIKGILVTTSGFGPGSRTFAEGKPLTLVSGPELVALLRENGLTGRLDDGTADACRADGPPPPPPESPGGHNLLGLSWSGSVALDVCALVCAGPRVLSDEHFVFYNNARTPEGAVAAVQPTGSDRASLRVAFDELPAAADRLVVAAAVDPESGPPADLAGFTAPNLRLRAADGTELGTLDVSDGRPGETALVLGSFRRRANGDWDFVPGGRGYAGGLEALVADHGVQVD
ncbi:restriction endonuclease [Streptomyces chumphonensis]|uniref:Restriction endonuclease n=1 Tax=Streptomyces chumphonensis TaxID=1214925 RepID=A0A927IEA5_9ACTN|nr:restriction endonuclease [Streptomyces chumphonensis]MBD3933977.1 restriction endonuclease [Streptomyces chumphonensis]